MLRWGAPSFSCGAEMFPINGEGVLFVFLNFFFGPPQPHAARRGRSFDFFLKLFLVPSNLTLFDGEGVLFVFF